MVQNSQEKKPDTKKKEKKCPFNSDGSLSCQNCRLFIHVSKDVGKVCAINFMAMRSE